jgi:YVTN family beta-propeller protein
VTELPSGTVTFLFTDVEGSTRLLKGLGEAYGEVLADHHRLLREAFIAHGAHEIDTQGDSFFVAFRRAKDAVAAAVDAQRALFAHGWPEGGQVRVRMGLHSGEPLVGEQRYVGLGVHKAARISGAGHGGQVLLSSATYELVADDLPAGAGVRDLGLRRLKDIDRPERIFQLVVEGLQRDFPRLKIDERQPRYRRRGVLAGALAGVIAAAIAIPLFALGQGGSGGGTVVGGNAVAVLDPHTNRVVGQVPVGARPGAIAFGSGSIWVANLDDQTVSRIDSSTRGLLRTIPVGDTPTGLAATKAGVWAVGSDQTGSDVVVRHIDPQFDVVATRTRVGNVVPGGRARSRPRATRCGWHRPRDSSRGSIRGRTGSCKRSTPTRDRRLWRSVRAPSGSPIATPTRLRGSTRPDS